jgi:hypothetical protein
MFYIRETFVFLWSFPVSFFSVLYKFTTRTPPLVTPLYFWVLENNL